jgi:hypothetical protein
MASIEFSGRPTLEERIALGRAASAFRRRSRRERLVLFRQHLQCNVTAASALLVHLDRLGEVDLAGAAWRMRPPSSWQGDPRRGGVSPTIGRSPDTPGTRGHPGWRVDRRGEVVLRRADHPAGFMSIRPCLASLEVSAAIGVGTVMTSGSLCYL